MIKLSVWYKNQASGRSDRSACDPDDGADLFSAEDGCGRHNYQDFYEGPAGIGDF